jgi:hypothetical protein
MEKIRMCITRVVHDRRIKTTKLLSNEKFPGLDNLYKICFHELHIITISKIKLWTPILWFCYNLKK